MTIPRRRCAPALGLALLLLAATLVRAQAGDPAPAGPAAGPAGRSGPAAEIRPPAALVAEGVPPVPASLPDEVRRYTEGRSATLADWHPRERAILISTRFGNTAQIHAVRAPGGARSQLTFFGEPVRGAAYEPRAGRYLLLTKDVGGDEFDQILRVDLRDGRLTLLTDGGRSQNGGLVWSTAGDLIAYGTTRRNGADRDLHVMDPLDPAGDRLVMRNEGGGWGVLDWSPDDRRLLVVELISVNETRLWLLDLATGERDLLTEPAVAGAEPVSYGRARFTRDGRGVILTSDLGSEFHRLARLDLRSRRLEPLVDSFAWDIETFDLSPDGSLVAFTVNEAGVSRLYLHDLRRRRTSPVRGLPEGVISGLRWHRERAELGFALASARSPGDVWSLEARSGKLTRWTESELGGLVASELPQPRLVGWTSFDGLEITGFLYEPPARFAGPRPVIIRIHGGPEGQARPGFLARENYWPCELGIALLLPNVRGSTGYGKSFVKLDNGLLREDSVRDIGALLDWIAQEPSLDAGRVMVAGGSYGGYMSLASAVHYSDRIRGAVDVVGISNFNTFLQNTEDYRRDLRRVEYGDERDPVIRDFFERISPLNNAERIRKPLFVVQGANDPRVPRSEAEQIVERVRRGGVPVWYLLAMDEGHGFRKKENADFQFYATVLFAREHLLGTAAISTEDAASRPGSAR